MAKDLVLTVDTTQVMRALEKLGASMATVAGQALREEAEIEMTEAKQRTPVDTGALRASGRVSGPVVKAKDIEVRMEFGNASVDYALVVHENVDAFHAVGQSKFLESTLVESMPHLPDRIGKRIKRILG